MTKFKKITEEVLDESEELFEMSNLTKARTHLSANIWVDDFGISRNIPHLKPRIKFQADKADKAHGPLIPMSIDKKPEILIKNYKTELNNYEIGQIKNFIIRNYDLLIEYWNQEINIDQLQELIKRTL